MKLCIYRQTLFFGVCRYYVNFVTDSFILVQGGAYIPFLSGTNTFYFNFLVEISCFFVIKIFFLLSQSLVHVLYSFLSLYIRFTVLPCSRNSCRYDISLSLILLFTASLHSSLFQSFPFVVVFFFFIHLLLHKLHHPFFPFFFDPYSSNLSSHWPSLFLHCLC